MRKILAVIRFSLVFVFIIAAAFEALVVFPRCSPERRGQLIKQWAQRFLRWIGCRIELHGQLPATMSDQVLECGLTPNETGRLIVSNHISFLDVFALNGTIPSRMVAKAEIARWPVLGSISRQTGTIFIDRSNRRALLGIAETMGKGLKDGSNLLVFPEGTTSDGTGLLKLHSNLFDSAVKNQAQVVPVILQYLSENKPTLNAAYVGDTGLFECLWKIVNTPDLCVKVTMLEPVPASTTRHELCQIVSQKMSQALGVADPLAKEEQR